MWSALVQLLIVLSFVIFWLCFKCTFFRLDSVIQGKIIAALETSGNTSLLCLRERYYLTTCALVRLNHRIEVNMEKLETIEKLLPPLTTKDIHSFSGYVGCYQCFIKDFWKISRPMTNLLERDIPFYFNNECLRSFQLLKRRFIGTSIMRSPEWNPPFEIMCDANALAVGVILG